jgi:hypothetical protein
MLDGKRRYYVMAVLMSAAFLWVAIGYDEILALVIFWFPAHWLVHKLIKAA